MNNSNATNNGSSQVKISFFRSSKKNPISVCPFTISPSPLQVRLTMAINWYCFMQNFGDQHFQSWIIVVLDCSDAIIVGRRFLYFFAFPTFPREIEIQKKSVTLKKEERNGCILIIFKSVRSPRMIDNRWFVRPSDEGWNDKIELCLVTVIGTENGTRPGLASAATPWGRTRRHRVSSFEFCLVWKFHAKSAHFECGLLVVKQIWPVTQLGVWN